MSDTPIRCDALLFDLDGVLVDSTASIENTWRRWASTHGLPADDVLAVVHGRRATEVVSLLAPHLQVDAEVAALGTIESTTTEGIREVPGARALLQSLPADAWGIVTSGPRVVATLRIQHVGLPWPPVLICADEVSRGKPDPEGYLAAAERLRVDPAACVVIEDAAAGLKAARAAGMRSIAVTSTQPSEMLQAANFIVPDLATLRVSITDRRLSIWLR
ncbi:MAG TPA: HAD-IA family hydrolase [Gemmatimonadaceae bacterium]